MTAQGVLPEPAGAPMSAASSPSPRRLLSVVVPVVERIDDLVTVYRAFAQELEQRGELFEFIFVFDGGCTPPPELVERGHDASGVHLFRFAQHFGETAALRLGIERSQGEVILTLPPYFQVQPEGIGPLLDAVANGADLAVACRSPRRDNWLNRMQSRAFHRMLGSISGQRFRDIACGVRAIRRRAAVTLPLYGDMHRFIPAIALREGFEVTEVAVPQHPSDVRMRIYGPGVYLRRLLDITAFFFLAKFTEKPLRFFGLVGSMFLGVGGALSLYLLIDRLAGRAIANRPLLLLGVLLIALGVQLIGLGLVGEIIVHLRSPHRRAYRIREQI